jgi:hypothetical protein
MNILDKVASSGTLALQLLLLNGKAASQKFRSFWRWVAMGWLFGVGTIVGMVVLRLAVPVSITVLLCYLLGRLNAKWQAEARAMVAR